MALAVILGGWGTISTGTATSPRIQTSPPASFAPGVLLVKRKAGIAQASLTSQSGVRGIAGTLGSTGVDQLSVTPGQELAIVQLLKQSGLVEYAQPDYVLHATDVIPNDPYYPDQWDFPDVGAPSAWETTEGATSVTVAVIDTGFYLGHPDQPAHLIQGPTYSSLAAQDGCPPEGPAPMDDNGHGTHVTGTIAAAFNNGIGVASLAPNVSLLAIKAGDCVGDFADSDIASALDYAANNGAKVVNMSFGGPSTPGGDPVVADAVSYAWGKGVVLVAAAGNDGSSEYFIPADLPNVIAVAATDGANMPSYYSNWGSSVSVAAPGGDFVYDPGVLSTYAPTGQDCPGADYCYLAGTSMASPHVAAEAGLLLSIASTSTNSEIISTIKAAVNPIQNVPAGRYYGTGIIDLCKAVNQARLTASAAPVQQTSTPLPVRAYLPLVPDNATCD